MTKKTQTIYNYEFVSKVKFLDIGAKNFEEES